MPFKPGQSGNPRGARPKSPAQWEFERKCKTYLENFGYKQIEELAQGKDKKYRAWALDTMLDRAYGRPVQSIDADVATRKADPEPDILADSITAIVAGEVIGGAGADNGRGKDAQA